MINEVYNLDCMEGMAKYPNKYFELAIVDPPYGIGINISMGRRKGNKKSNYHKFAGNDSSIPTKEYFNELFRVSKNQIVWGGNYYDLPKTKGWIVWKKMDIKNDYNPLEMAWTNNMKMGFIDLLWCGMWQEDMKNKEKRIHPTQKPIKLYKWVLQNYAKQGDKILDTHLGSGSSRIAAYDYGFDFVGFELDKDYFESQEKRFKNHIAQQKLF